MLSPAGLGQHDSLACNTSHISCCPCNNNNCSTCQPRLGACGASLSSPGRLVLSNLIGVGNRQMVNVRQDHIVTNVPRLANMAWTLSMCDHVATCTHQIEAPAAKHQPAPELRDYAGRWQPDYLTCNTMPPVKMFYLVQLRSLCNTH